MKTSNIKKNAFLLLIAIAISRLAFGQYTFNRINVGGGGWVTGLIIHPTEANLVYCRTDVGGVYKWNNSTSEWEQLIRADRMPTALMNYTNSMGDGIGRSTMYNIEGFAIAPSNSNILFVSAGDQEETGFLLKSTNKGQSFVMTNLNVKMAGNKKGRMYGDHIAVDPANANIVYYGSRKAGLQVSTNGGIDFTQVSTTKVPVGINKDGTEVGVNDIAFDPSGGTTSGKTNRIYASVWGDGLYYSSDAGNNWLRVITYSSGGASDLEVVGGIAYVAIRLEGVKKYTPSGGVVTITPGSETKIESITVDPNNSSRIYAVDEGFKDFYRSINGGGNWVKLSPTTNTDAGRNYFQSNDILWVENSSVRTWLSIGKIVIDPHNSSRMWFAEGMGVWQSTDISDTQNGPTFNNISKGIEEMVASDAVSNGSKVVLITWDRLGFVKDATNIAVYPTGQVGLTDKFVTGSSVALAPGNNNFFAATSVNHNGYVDNASGYSENAGSNWSTFGSISSGANNPADLVLGEIEISANNTSNMVWVNRKSVNYSPWFVTDIYYTTNKGGSWQKSTPSGWYNSGQYYLTSKKVLTADQVAGGTFYTYSWGDASANAWAPIAPAKIFKSTNGGQSWVSQAPSALPAGVWHGQLKAAPGKAGHIWFCTGYDHRTSIVNQKGLFFSTDGGASMTRMANIDECWAFGFGKTANGASYPTIFMYGKVSGAWGLYRSINQGSNWEKIVDYPLGLFDKVTVVEGDPIIYGRVYIGYAGNTFVYGNDNSGDPGGTKLYEAESYTAKSGVNLATSNKGYSGTGYMDYGGNATWLEWNNVNVTTAGNYTLAFRYANGTSTNRQCQLIVNGVSQGNIAFNNTGGWATWQNVSSGSVSLNAGNNTIRLTANTSNGGPNLDKMDIAAFAAVKLAEISNDMPDISATNVRLYPNPVTDQLHVNIIYEGSYQITIMNYLGQSVHSEITSNLSFDIDMSGLRSGLYYVKVSGMEVSSVHTIIKR